MCNDPDCVYRFVLEDQFRQDIIRKYKQRHEDLMYRPGYPLPPVELPSPDTMRKLIKKRVDYLNKYWSKHRQIASSPSGKA